MTGPLPPALAMISGQLVRMAERISRLERGQRAAQLDLSTVENGALAFTDDAGTVRSLVGLQGDGSFAHGHFGAPAPVSPSAPLVLPVINGLAVTWDGTMGDGSAPLADFAGVQVHCSQQAGFAPGPATLQGLLPGAGVLTVTGLPPGTTYYAALVAVNLSGSLSEPSAPASGVPESVIAHIPDGSITGSQIAFTARHIGGITTSIQSGQPQDPQAGDLWYDADNGYLLNTWNGSAWVPYQFGTGAIQAGSVTAALIAANTITAAQIAAGTIVAGVVDGTTITGAQFVATGTAGEILAYDGTPAAGNLIASIAARPGTDSFGNAYLAGTTQYDQVALLALQAGGGGTSALTWLSAASQAGPYSSVAELILRDLNELDVLLTGTGAGLGQFVLSNHLLTGALTSALLEVQGVLAFAGSNTSPSAPSPAISFASGTPAQMPDLTRDFIVYFVFSGAGNLTLKIGSVNPPGRTLFPASAVVAGAMYSFRVPAGWWVEWTGTGTVAMANQECVGC